MRVVEGGRKMCEVLETCLTSFLKIIALKLEQSSKK